MIAEGRYSISEVFENNVVYVVINGLKGLVFDSMSRNGTLHIYSIIKWLNFVQKRDFHRYMGDIYNKKPTHF